MFEAVPNLNQDESPVSPEKEELMDKSPVDRAISLLIDDLSASNFVSVEQVLRLWELSADDKELLIKGTNLSLWQEMNEDEKEALAKLQGHGSSIIHALREASTLDKAA